MPDMPDRFRPPTCHEEEERAVCKKCGRHLSPDDGELCTGCLEDTVQEFQELVDDVLDAAIYDVLDRYETKIRTVAMMDLCAVGPNSGPTIHAARAMLNLMHPLRANWRVRKLGRWAP